MVNSDEVGLVIFVVAALVIAVIVYKNRRSKSKKSSRAGSTRVPTNENRD